jgi:hypothetical protein
MEILVFLTSRRFDIFTKFICFTTHVGSSQLHSTSVILFTLLFTGFQVPALQIEVFQQDFVVQLYYAVDFVVLLDRREPNSLLPVLQNYHCRELLGEPRNVYFELFCQLW